MTKFSNVLFVGSLVFFPPPRGFGKMSLYESKVGRMMNGKEAGKC